MPSIGNNQFPYPNTSDEPNVPGDLQKLALAVDTAIGGGNRFVDTLADLQAIPNTQLYEGMRATVTSDTNTINNGEYEYMGGAWIFLIGDVSKLFTLQNTAYWNLKNLKAIRNHNHVDVSLIAIRLTAPLNNTTSWYVENFITFDPMFSPSFEIHEQATSNASTPQSLMMQIIGTSLNIRKPAGGDSLIVNGWVEFSGGWNF